MKGTSPSGSCEGTSSPGYGIDAAYPGFEEPSKDAGRSGTRIVHPTSLTRQTLGLRATRWFKARRSPGRPVKNTLLVFYPIIEAGGVQVGRLSLPTCAFHITSRGAAPEVFTSFQ